MTTVLLLKADRQVPCMKDDIEKRIQRYFGDDISRMRLLGITKYAVVTYVLRIQGG